MRAEETEGVCAPGQGWGWGEWCLAFLQHVWLVPALKS